MKTTLEQMKQDCTRLDAKWVTELTRQFGSDYGDARYTPSLHDAECKAAGDNYRAAHRAYLEYRIYYR